MSARSVRARGALAALLALLGAARGVRAQEAAPAPAPGTLPGLALDSLLTPASPALVLLGASPVAIERPTTPKAVALLVTNAIRDNDGFPRNLAVEIAPYWLTSHPRLTFEDYYRAGPGQRMLQTLGLSVATSRLDPVVAGGAAGTSLAFGFRTSPIAGRAHPALDSAVAALRAVQTEFLEALPDDATDEQIRALWERRFAGRVADAGRRVRALDEERVGVMVDVAGALVMDFPGDVAGSGRVTRGAFWLAPAYRPRDGAVEVVALARWVLDRRSGRDRHQFDVGLRTILNVGALAASLEFVEYAGDRLADGAAPSYRLAGNLQYRVGRGSAVEVTFGRDDRIDTGQRAGVVARVGLNLGFGTIPLLGLGGVPR